MTLLLIAICLIGAAAAGWFIFMARSEFSTRPFSIAAIGGHGFMLAYMGGFALGGAMMHGGMLTASALSALPMIAMGALKLKG